MLSQLEAIERAKLKRRENMTKILDKLNEASSSQNEMKRAQLQKMVKEELENWDEPLDASRMDDYQSRAASARSDFHSSAGLNKKMPWFNQN